MVRAMRKYGNSCLRRALLFFILDSTPGPMCGKKGEATIYTAIILRPSTVAQLAIPPPKCTSIPYGPRFKSQLFHFSSNTWHVAWESSASQTKALKPCTHVGDPSRSSYPLVSDWFSSNHCDHLDSEALDGNLTLSLFSLQICLSSKVK